MELEFDYVIIGAGSAGCVLANRLSAIGKIGYWRSRPVAVIVVSGFKHRSATARPFTTHPSTGNTPPNQGPAAIIATATDMILA